MQKPRIILLVDDSENDRYFMRAGFKKVASTNTLFEVQNGEEAIAYLKGEKPYDDRVKFPLPSVMLLDLNMPRIDGFEVLSWVRSQKGLRRLTIVVVSASTREEDIERALDLGANSYLVKPGSISDLITTIQCFCDWIECNEFPPLEEVGLVRSAPADASS